MARRLNSIYEVDDSKETWKLPIRIMNIWCVDSKQGGNTEMLLIDEKVMCYFLSYVVYFLCYIAVTLYVQEVCVMFSCTREAKSTLLLKILTWTNLRASLKKERHILYKILKYRGMWGNLKFAVINTSCSSQRQLLSKNKIYLQFPTLCTNSLIL